MHGHLNVKSGELSLNNLHYIRHSSFILIKMASVINVILFLLQVSWSVCFVRYIRQPGYSKLFLLLSSELLLRARLN